MDAQMIVFMLMSVTKLEYMMFNDQFVSFFIAVALYLFVHNQPQSASALVGIALSCKAPVVLILPGYLGTI